MQSGLKFLGCISPSILSSFRLGVGLHGTSMVVLHRQCCNELLSFTKLKDGGHEPKSLKKFF